MILARNKKVTGILCAGLLGASAFSFTQLIDPPSSHAGVCGYYETTEHYDSNFKISILGMDLSPFSGERRVANYGHCSNDGTNTKIRIETANGPEEACVPPGDHRLGFVNNDKKISNAYSIGRC